jgi:energy-coupling factor transporter ATP-binding protein EcfA2
LNILAEHADMTDIPRCFISYSHEGIDRDALRYLEYLLVNESQQRVQLLLDENLPYGRSIGRFMQTVLSVEAVLMIMTPDYKRRVSNPATSVAAEYKAIMTRHQAVDRELREGSKPADIAGYFQLIPVLFSGTENESVPDEVHDYKWIDLTGLTPGADATGNFIITQHTKRQYVPAIRLITDQVLASTTLKTPSLKLNNERLFHALFVDNKADWSNPEDFDTLFVKTFAFQQIRTGNVYITVGRKGSGKSTVAEVMAQSQGQRYKGTVAIIAEHINLDAAYELFDTSKVRSDLRLILSRLQSFEMGWEAYITLWCMHVLLDLDDCGDLSAYQQQCVPSMRALIDEIWNGQRSHDIAIINSTYFTYAFQQVVNFIDDTIQNARPSPQFFFSDITSKFHSTNYLKYVFGEAPLTDFHLLLDTCSRKFLVTLDGFDNAFENFRKASINNPSEIERRAAFETDWLRSLLHVVLRIRSTRRAAPRFYELLEFCMAVPEDRFFDLIALDRDAFRYQGNYAHLDWSGVELSILLRKRLERYSGYRSSKSKAPEDRLNDVIRNAFPYLPREINFRFNDRQYKMPLFSYVLRHTFWRPRDVLTFYALLIAVGKALHERKLKMTADITRRTIQLATHQVIRDEFLNEFRSTLLNIDDVIYRFEHRRQYLTYADLQNIIGEVEFRFALQATRIQRTDDKIAFLYEIGFLGVVAQDGEVKRQTGHDHAFYFNEGNSLFNIMRVGGFRNCIFVVHPVFAEHLRLDTSGHRLVLEFSWEYLKEMEALLFRTGGLRTDVARVPIT